MVLLSGSDIHELSPHKISDDICIEVCMFVCDYIGTDIRIDQNVNVYILKESATFTKIQK